MPIASEKNLILHSSSYKDRFQVPYDMIHTSGYPETGTHLMTRPKANILETQLTFSSLLHNVVKLNGELS